MLKNFIYLYKKKTQVVFFWFFILSDFHFYLMNALVYVDIDQSIHKVKRKVAQNEKKLLGFSFYINVFRNLNLSAKHLFWRCDKLSIVFKQWTMTPSIHRNRFVLWKFPIQIGMARPYLMVVKCGGDRKNVNLIHMVNECASKYNHSSSFPILCYRS